MASNVFWNLVFLLDVGGVIGLAIVALDRWPWLAHRLELLFYGAGCLVALALALGFILANSFGPTRGVNIHGIRYTDAWRDD